MGWREEWRAARDATERAIRQRSAQLAEGVDAIEARGRRIADEAIRAGRDIAARTPAEIRQLGMAAKATTDGVRRAVVDPARRVIAEAQTPAGRVRLIESAKQQGRAAVSGAVDEASYGLADPVLSGFEAVANGGFDSGLSDRYAANQARRTAEDLYDEQHYGAARTVGQVAGIAATVAETGLAGMATKAAAKRLAPEAFAKASAAANKLTRVADMTPGGLTGLSVAGGATAGAAGQVANDLATGRLSTAGDYAGAILGGAVDGLALRGPKVGAGRLAERVSKLAMDPRVAGAAGSATTQGLQDVFNGRDVDAVEVARAARDGAVGAQLGDVTGKYVANAMPRKMKEDTGEFLSALKAFAAGEGTYWGKPVQNFDSLLPVLPFKGAAPSPGRQRRIALPGGGHTRADFVTDKAIGIEAKFGAGAELTPRQIQALSQLPPDRYRVYHWLPSDIGRIASVPIASVAGQWGQDEEDH